MTRGRAHDPQTKAAALTALLTGAGVREVARTHGLGVATVSAWRRQAFTLVAEESAPAEGSGTAPGDLVPAGEFEQFEPKKRAAPSIPELVLDYLAASLDAQTAQVRLMGDPTWLRQQSAADLALLHGILNDKAVRLLYTLRPTDGAR